MFSVLSTALMLRGGQVGTSRSQQLPPRITSVLMNYKFNDLVFVFYFHLWPQSWALPVLTKVG